MGSVEYISEWLAAIFALIFFYKYRMQPIRLVLLILWIAIIAETAARLWIDAGYTNNHWIYNCYAILFYGLFYKMTYDHIKNSKRKKIVALLSILMLAVIIFRSFTSPFATRFMTHTFNVATAVMVINLMYYAIDLLKSDINFILRERLEAFVFVAYAIFAVSFIPLSPLVFAIWGDFSSSAAQTLSDIQGAILIVMNLILIFGFVWTRKQR
ncbi:hypothetical protein EAX61_14150 [Dokdonia sinensis]|uniref:Uncharacterized protein n=2 Tax=Dokdonia sinensis TaxID=2479847 RepID=A0A3M0FX77_9FLAO|nr:hypothetical protein EAX61_14150 [Dokdonia sinensis]